ncbi:MAG: FAD-dependent oxidoreductase [Burkholderiales bacterium]|nr:FAD-dependent oxidoreductase [Burkholderiales bacterium]
MSAPHAIVIVGAGQAGGCAAKTLRDEGFAGRITLIGLEPHPPYERPPLSKRVLAGAATVESCRLFKPDAFAALNLDFRPGARATRIDRAARAVHLESGESVAYDKLILATGGEARRLPVPGGDGPRVHYLRTLDESLAIRSALGPGRRLAVVGGGWIGLEVAATARKSGAAVTVLEALDRVCVRAVPPSVSDFLRALHERNGVAIRTNCGVKAIDDRGAGGLRLALGDGTALDADAVVVGIGLVPQVSLAREAGLEVGDGVLVDERCRTSDPDILVAGDCANMPLACLGRRVRLESWANAQNQAIAAAKSALGQDVRYDELPWFWSDQYDANVQILGLPARWPEPIVRGDRDGASFSLFYLDDDRIVAVVSVNAPRDLRAARRPMQVRKTVRAVDLADPATNLAKL